MKIGVYVGSFDPVHKGHIEIVNYLINNKYIDYCIIVPTLGYWDKNNQIDIKDRINMLKFFESDKIKIDTKNNSLSYSYQVLNSIKNEHKEDELYLIIGNDLLKDFNKWKNVEEILKHKILVIPRIDINTEEYVTDRFVVVKEFEVINISSTEIKNNFYKRSKFKMLNLIDEKVYDYILRNGLYKEVK